MSTSDASLDPNVSATKYLVPAGHQLWYVGADFPGFPDGFGAEHRLIEVSLHETTALAERFLTGAEFDDAGRRRIPDTALDGVSAGCLRTTRELVLARLLDEKDFLALGAADDRSVMAGEYDQRKIEHWARQLYQAMPAVQGLVWQSGVDMPRPTAILFADRCHDALVGPSAPIRLDTQPGIRWLAGALSRFRVELPDAAEYPLVFLNYRTADDSAAVAALDRELVARLGEAAVFRDVRSMPPGTWYPPTLVDKAAHSTVLVVVAGPKWEGLYGHQPLTSPDDWVRKEIEIALAHNVQVVPILVGLRRPIDKAALPAEVAVLADLQVVALRHGYRAADVAAVVDELFQECPLLLDASALHRARQVRLNQKVDSDQR